MNTGDEHRLVRLIHGELPADEVRELERRMAREPELKTRYLRLAGIWRGLEPPLASPVPADFGSRIVDAARRQQRTPWSPSPAWARAGAVAALMAGLLLGTSVGTSFNGAVSGPELTDDEDAYELAGPLSLGESFWLTIAENEGRLGNGGDREDGDAGQDTSR